MKFNFELTILSETDDYAVLIKPAGLVVTPGATYEEADTLVGWLVARYGESIRTACVEGHRPGIVHRLDKDTSGVMVIAKNLKTFLNLTSQFASHKVKKEYTTICWGNVRETLLAQKQSDESTFIINAPLGRNPRNRTRHAVVKNGKPAITRFVIEDTFVRSDKTFTSLTSYPETGRTHQIRIHLKSIGHSIVGDELYQQKSEKLWLLENAKTGDFKERMYLHAYSLSFTPPNENVLKSFTSPVPW